MSFLPCKRMTPYCVLLSERAGAYFRDVGWSFTMKELADFAGLKPTHNMRRRLRTWVQEGHLQMVTYLDEAGRMQIAYQQPILAMEEVEKPS